MHIALKSVSSQKILLIGQHLRSRAIAIGATGERLKNTKYQRTGSKKAEKTLTGC